MKKVKVKGALRTYMFSLLYVAILLLIVAVFVALKDLYFGLLIACIAVLCAVLYAVLYFRSGKIILNELVSFATAYGQIQKKLLHELELPYIIVDDKGKISIHSNHSINMS